MDTYASFRLDWDTYYNNEPFLSAWMRIDVEAYRPDQAVEDERNTRRNEYIGRLFRIICEEREMLVPYEKMDEHNALVDKLT
jgi:hypothetical protein